MALEISGNATEPAYRDGAVIIVMRAAPVRRNDRVVVKTKAGELMVRELKRKSRKWIELRSINLQDAERKLALRDVLWIARIVWASQ
jgi:phage repressor protein C with HTH and peptisase S24 domain